MEDERKNYRQYCEFRGGSGGTFVGKCIVIYAEEMIELIRARAADVVLCLRSVWGVGVRGRAHTWQHLSLR